MLAAYGTPRYTRFHRQFGSCCCCFPIQIDIDRGGGRGICALFRMISVIGFVEQPARGMVRFFSVMLTEARRKACSYAYNPAPWMDINQSIIQSIKWKRLGYMRRSAAKTIAFKFLVRRTFFKFGFRGRDRGCGFCAPEGTISIEFFYEFYSSRIFLPFNNIFLSLSQIALQFPDEFVCHSAFVDALHLHCSTKLQIQ